MIKQLLPQTVRVELDLRVDPMIETDEATLQRAIVNLALNARDAMPDGGELRLTLRDPGAGEIPQSLAEGGSYACVTVHDTGVGIEAQAQERIFEPFYSTKGRGGSGLGLASVRESIAALGGHVFVESEVGKGTTFVTLWRIAAARDTTEPVTTP
jgi:signal transduction histidine kinase